VPRFLACTTPGVLPCLAAAWVSAGSRAAGGPIFYWDERALNLVTRIEKAIVALDLDSQGQFIALTNAIELQLESGAPVPDVVRLLGEALLALAQARHSPQQTQIDLARRVSALHNRVSKKA